MSGGADEYVMGNMVWTNGQQMSGYRTNNNNNSAFTGILHDSGKGTSFTGTYAFPSKRYYDRYSYGTNAEYTRGKLGDAIVEMAPRGVSGGGWYIDNAFLPYGHDPWFDRGGYYESGTYAGAFSFASSAGRAFISDSTRAVISNLN